MKIGDADNDGQNELLIAYGWGNYGPHLIILKPRGDGFYPVWEANFPFGEAAEMSVDVGDANGDGQNEVVAMNATPSDINSNGKIRIYKHIGGNNYQLLWSDNLNQGFRRIAVGNIDGDHAEEIVIGNSFYDRTLYYYDYQGGNNWSKIEIEYVGEDCHGLQIADADNDGQKEIIVGLGIWPNYTVRIYKYLAGRIQRIWNYSFCSVSLYEPGYGVYVGDVDNDGRNEILVTEESPHQERNYNDVFIFEHTGGTNWQLYWQMGFPWPHIGARCPYIGRIQNTAGNEFCFLGKGTLYVYRWTGSTYARIAAQHLPNVKVEQNNSPSVNSITGGDCDNDGEHETVVLLGATVFIFDRFGVGISEKDNLKSIPIGRLSTPRLNLLKKEIRISYILSSEGLAEIRILDQKGNIVRKIKVKGIAGQNEIIWDGKDDMGRTLPSGNYFYHLYQNGKQIGGAKIVKVE
ncbi:MAG: FG-GAP-like repeat-containing protein [candidate division WOR-3 bacterium]|nr:FG-GAP-like repeat-containing protein [candidate division WOR-3 bacterium]MCX7837473.1 FG-GAP-like repeat-containing protein [candidate division WOR-3 bacterium]MDW8114224.1 FG-GAP-like repeat-containing protein [candidate division WOR-3 bacterium]